MKRLQVILQNDWMPVELAYDVTDPPFYFIFFKDVSSDFS